jgi:nonsense-mediated mRNA decay protein 3
VFCVACGKETAPLSDHGLCRDCFLERHAVVTLPEKVDVEVCVHCGSRKIGERWSVRPPGRPADERDRARLAEDAAIDAARLLRGLAQPTVGARAKAQDVRNFAVEVTASGEAEGFAVAGSATTVARIKGATCLRCSRIQGGYFESIVQLRATDRDLVADELAGARKIADRVVERILDQGDQNAFVLREEERDGGLDIYLGTTNAGRMVAKSFGEAMGARLSEHAKIVGLKDGLDVFRVTFSVRIPSYRTGDLVLVDERPWIVSHIGTKVVSARSPLSGEARSFERDALEKKPVVRRAEAREAVVVNRRGSDLEVLDPWTYATRTVVAPPGLDGASIGHSVLVVRVEDALVLLPRA